MQLARLIFSLALAAAISSCATPNKYERAQKSVALLETERAQKSVALLETEHDWGSGFPVQRTNPAGHPRIFLWTAAHVVSQVNTVKVHQVIRSENHKVGETVFTATVIARDVNYDLALLWLDAPAGYFFPVRFDKHNVLPVGSAVYHCGNFHGPAFDGSISTGVISQLGVHPYAARGWPWHFPLDQTTCIVEPGSSGGPLFCDIDNSVCGVIVGHVTAGVEFFVPLRDVVAFARLHSVSFSVSGYRCPSDALLHSLEATAHHEPPKPKPEPEDDPNKPIDE